jgi:hypothetical protein
MSFNWRRARLIVFGVCAGALLLAVQSANSVAAETHAFDPVLSLTGTCDEKALNELDPVPDPGPCPGIKGVDHPNFPFSSPRAVATDSYGDIYVATGSGSQGRIDIFGPTGKYISEVPDELTPGSLGIDSKGDLYVGNNFSTEELQEDYARFEPTEYKPAEEKIAYGKAPELVVNCGCTGVGASLDVDRSLAPEATDRLFLKLSSVRVGVYKSAAEGNSLIENIFLPSGAESLSAFSVDSAHGRISLADRVHFGPGITETEPAIQVLELAPPHALLFEVKGTAVPANEFNIGSVAADEDSGHFFGYDAIAKKVYEFDEGGKYLSTIEHGFKEVGAVRIGVDNGIHSPNGAELDAKGGRYLYVPSNPTGVGHTYAFGPPREGEPKVESTSFDSVGEAEAQLRASIEPFGLPTHYTFEYLTTQQYEEQGNTFTGAQLAGEGTLPAANSPLNVAAVGAGLTPQTRYRFRVFAENTLGSDEAEGEFATYPAAVAFEPCPNEATRSGLSALLPDCRAYELVTPANTNGHPILAPPRSAGGLTFPTRATSPSGGAVSFLVEGGAIPGFEGTSGLRGDPYLASRGSGGWQTAAAGPKGVEAESLQPGSVSPDQGYSFWGTSNGSKVTAPGQNNFLRYPSGESEVVGRGGLGEDPNAAGLLISQDGSHILFTSSTQLEEDAPPAGTQALYDRTIDPVGGGEQTHVVSLLPGNETPAAGETAFYIGASLDGKGVAFRIGTTLYLRYNNEETYELGAGAAFAGIAEGGARAFYLKGGDLLRFDATTQVTTPFSTSGDVTPVNVSADGSTAYFVSPSVLSGEENPNGEEAVAGKENLYRSEEGQISFVATVTERDVEGEGSNFPFDGLGTWIFAVREGRPATEASRTTPDGRTLLFQSRADLAGYDPEGHSEVYRYDFSGNELACLSCNPTLAPATSNSVLQSISQGWGQDNLPLQSFADTRNLRADGKRAFFESSEALVPADVDGLRDVYEWEAEGVGSCKRTDGCLYLISSGSSAGPDYLYAVSDSGENAFVHTPDLLLPSQDPDETPSIYDARVDGGFAPETSPPDPCLGEACQPAAVPPPRSPLASSVFEGAGNVVPKKPCSKAGGKRKKGCAHHKHKHHHRKHSTKRRAGR